MEDAGALAAVDSSVAQFVAGQEQLNQLAASDPVFSQLLNDYTGGMQGKFTATYLGGPIRVRGRVVGVLCTLNQIPPGPAHDAEIAATRKRVAAVASMFSGVYESLAV